jgi:hypothetical protein
MIMQKCQASTPGVSLIKSFRFGYQTWYVSVVNKQGAPTNRVKSETFMWTRFLYAGVFKGKFGNYLAFKFCALIRLTNIETRKYEAIHFS